MMDLASYKNKILSVDDIPLFDDALKAAGSGALRAAYIMIWLSCAESLKRKFREAQQRDCIAAKIVGEFEKKEAEHRSIDKFLLDKAREYGFLSDSTYTVLFHVYEMRCIYGHPYEEAPKEEQVLNAAATVIEYVLAQPVKLRQGFGKQLLNNLMKDPLFLDSQRETVARFTKEVIPKIDSSIHGWILKSYWQELEKIADDPTMKVFFLRGIWFTQTYLNEIGVDIFVSDQWHREVIISPKTLARVFANHELFSRVGCHAQDYLVGKLIDISNSRSDTLSILENLYNNGVLSPRQQQRLTQKIDTIDFSKIISAGLGTALCFTKIIDALKSHSWYSQNPAIDFLRSNGPEQLGDVSLADQCLLGRNILQATEGNSSSAINLLELISENPEKWPINIVRGIILEVFSNEEKQIRFKIKCISEVLKMMEKFDRGKCNDILAEVAINIREGQPQYHWIGREEFHSVSNLLDNYEWGKILKQCLDEKASMLPEIVVES